MANDLMYMVLKDTSNTYWIMHCPDGKMLMGCTDLKTICNIMCKGQHILDEIYAIHMEAEEHETKTKKDNGVQK